MIQTVPASLPGGKGVSCLTGSIAETQPPARSFHPSGMIGQALPRILLIVFAFVFIALSVHAAKSPAEFRTKSADWFRSDDGRRITSNVLSWQSKEGSWPKNTDTFSKPFAGDAKSLQGTFDNGATTDELRFLARAFNATSDARCSNAVTRGIANILAAQYPNGGWPQYSPPPANKYHRHITFNDGSMTRLMDFMREITTNKTFAFLDTTQRAAARGAFDRGIGCILKCQIRVDGRLTAWCAQHDEKDFTPRPARSYELASLSGSESVGVTRLLMSLDTPGPEVIRAVDAAVAWFEAAKLPGIRVETVPDKAAPKGKDKVVVKDAGAKPMWARFHEIGSNKPIFCGRDGVRKDSLAEIEHERRIGYAWLGYWPETLLEKEYPAWQKQWRTKTGSR